MRIELIDDQAVSATTRGAIARYRHRVFIESLQWDLPCDPGHEQDEFDAEGATHLAAFDGDQVVGYARLLPTLRPYLLATHFANLLNGAAAPQSAEVWELSRFAAGHAAQPGSASDAKAHTRIGKRVLLEAVRFVMARNGEQLICCTTVAVERLAHRWGVDIERLGPPVRTSAGLLVAARIHCSRQTLEALEPAAVQITSTAGSAASLHAPGHVPLHTGLQAQAPTTASAHGLSAAGALTSLGSTTLANASQDPLVSLAGLAALKGHGMVPAIGHHGAAHAIGSPAWRKDTRCASAPSALVTGGRAIAV
ncbi:acyl-homoserine-lactone synthase [Roseateles amylovorans]|uniref:Acyl-homoserine-lactone synthase n=1 Tax=Roseateles amylovorans TaxID=2978473 RepID=A0ABY6B0F7_9BURK|nr:acyl-homoserine-lactone synthase [Roseateles amylovorans]UXH77464.1 hypothetical protein N4261_21090 [Roseateles amylovorans]